MAKVLFINPVAKKYLRSGYKEFSVPLGLTYLASNIRKHNYDVEILDCLAEGFDNEEIIERKDSEIQIRYGLSNEEIKNRIKEFKPEIVGVTNNFTSQYKEALLICQICKELDPNIITILGGSHPTGACQYILKNHKEVDFIIRGEGEESLKMLLELLYSFKEKDKYYMMKKIPNLSFRNKDNKVVVNNIKFQKNLDLLTIPAIDLLNLTLFKGKNAFHFELGGSKKDKWFPISFTRGCVYNCDFCISNKTEGLGIRSFGIEYIIKFLDLLKQYDISDIFIEDNNFLRNRDLRRIIQLFRENGFAYQLSNGIDPTIINSDIINELKKSGCYKLYYPVETANAYILNSYKYSRKKELSNKLLSKNKENIKRITDLGIETAVGYMIGFPGETFEEIENTERVAKEIFEINKNLIITYVFCVTPFPGTKLYHLCKENELIPPNYDWHLKPKFYNYEHATIGPEIEKLKKIEEKRIDMMRRYNRTEIADFMIRGKSWNSYRLLKDIFLEKKIKS